jgi:hypothetical protein
MGGLRKSEGDPRLHDQNVPGVMPHIVFYFRVNRAKGGMLFLSCFEGLTRRRNQPMTALKNEVAAAGFGGQADLAVARGKEKGVATS